jgi:uncharacterized membrane protein
MKVFNLVAAVALLGLIVLGVSWEWWLAPLRPEGSWLILKVVPLLAGVFGILHGRRYTHQWMSMVVLLYFLEGSIRILEEGPVRILAGIEILLSIALFVGCVGYAKLSGPSRKRKSNVPD